MQLLTIFPCFKFGFAAMMGSRVPGHDFTREFVKVLVRRVGYIGELKIRRSAQKSFLMVVVLVPARTRWPT